MLAWDCLISSFLRYATLSFLTTPLRMILGAIALWLTTYLSQNEPTDTI
ncbi:hypothetical protein [[Limnothrix rosea] IAM M-220]|nr:hypothetical protein [[Limnothrix rosea] IAM M-220]